MRNNTLVSTARQKPISIRTVDALDALIPTCYVDRDSLATRSNTEPDNLRNNERASKKNERASKRTHRAEVDAAQGNLAEVLVSLARTSRPMIKER